MRARIETSGTKVDGVRIAASLVLQLAAALRSAWAIARSGGANPVTYETGGAISSIWLVGDTLW